MYQAMPIRQGFCQDGRAERPSPEPKLSSGEVSSTLPVVFRRVRVKAPPRITPADLGDSSVFRTGGMSSLPVLFAPAAVLGACACSPGAGVEKMNPVHKLRDRGRCAATLPPTFNRPSAPRSRAEMLRAPLLAPLSATRKPSPQWVIVWPLLRRTTDVSDRPLGDSKSPQTARNKQLRSIPINYFSP